MKHFDSQDADPATLRLCVVFEDVWSRLIPAYGNESERTLRHAAEEVFVKLVNDSELTQQFLSGQAVMVVKELPKSVFAKHGFAVGFLSASTIKGGL